MKIFTIVSAILMMLGQLSFGASKQHIDQLADEYFAAKIAAPKVSSKILPKGLFSLAPGMQVPTAPGHVFDNFNCKPNSQECIDAACEKVGGFGCDEMSEIQAIGKACRGNFGGGCLKVSCDLLGWAGCNEAEEVIRVGKACAGNYDGECVKQVCDKLGWAGCNEIGEVEAVAQSCGGQ